MPIFKKLICFWYKMRCDVVLGIGCQCRMGCGRSDVNLFQTRLSSLWLLQFSWVHIILAASKQCDPSPWICNERWVSDDAWKCIFCQELNTLNNQQSATLSVELKDKIEECSYIFSSSHCNIELGTHSALNYPCKCVAEKESVNHLCLSQYPTT